MIEYGFFNAIDEDRTYNADSFNEYFNGLVTETGVYKKSGNGLQVVPGSGMAIKIMTGKARIMSHWAHVVADESMKLASADVALNRYDAVILRYSKEERTITPQVLTGTSAASPVKPSITQSDAIYDICLAYVYIKAGATSITADAITDTREDTALCGYAKLQIDAINAGIKEYRTVVTTTDDQTTVSLGISEFDAENDLLFANINGFQLVQGTDYTISGTGSAAKITFNTALDADNTLEFRVMKAVVEVLE